MDAPYWVTNDQCDIWSCAKAHNNTNNKKKCRQNDVRIHYAVDPVSRHCERHRKLRYVNHFMGPWRTCWVIHRCLRALKPTHLAHNTIEFLFFTFSVFGARQRMPATHRHPRPSSWRKPHFLVGVRFGKKRKPFSKYTYGRGIHLAGTLTSRQSFTFISRHPHVAEARLCERFFMPLLLWPFRAIKLPFYFIFRSSK